MPTPGTTTSSQYFRTLTTLHTAFLFGQLAFAGVAVMLRATGNFNFDPEGLKEILPLVAVAIAALGAGAGAAIFRKRRDELRKLDSLSQKLGDYRGAQIIRWAMLEGPALFCIIAFLLTGVYWVLGVVAVLVALFVSTRPSARKAVEDLQPTPEEEARLMSPEAVVE